jgi:DNA-binding SARP family transcriptional activator
VEFRLLGPLEVLGEDGGVLAVSGARERAVLAFLLLHAGRVVSTDRLIDGLWGDDPPEFARKSLQVRIAGLRKVIGAERVVTRPSGYLVRADGDELDVDRLQQLVARADSAGPLEAAALLDEALGLWRGPALSDFRGEPWAMAAAARLDELQLITMEKRFDAHLALGRNDEVVADLRVAVGEHPLRERLRAQLMLALYRAGRQSEALGVYQTTRRTMVEEFGIEPGQALHELERAILRQDDSLALAPLAMEQARSILIAALEEPNIGALLALAAPLAKHPPREVIVVRPNVARAELSSASNDLQRRQEALRGEGVVARSAVFTSPHPGRHVVRVASEQDVDLLLVDAPPDMLDDPVLADILAAAPCDVAVLAGGEISPGFVLVPFTGAEHDWSAIEIAAWLGLALDSPLRLAGPASETRDASRLLADASLAIQRAFGITAEPFVLDAGPEALVTSAARAAVVVTGLSDRWSNEGLGPVRSRLLAGAAPVVLVRRGLRPGGLAPAASYTRFTWTVMPST